MSVAVGLAFTGCGNSSNGGSTGSTFEQVPLIVDDQSGVNIEFRDANLTINIDLKRDGTLGIAIGERLDSADFCIGSWTAKQLSNNTYQIELSGIVPSASYTCDMKCNAPIILTIPENKLEAYRNGEVVNGATLDVDFTHDGGYTCTLPESVQEIKGTKTGSILQYAVSVPAA
ncbi:MAG: hypothetical protein ACI4OZ_00900 [Akkermansia sp.]